MSDTNSFHFLNQDFSKFLISGVVFIVFTLLMPSFIWVNVVANVSANDTGCLVFIQALTESILKMADQPTLIVLLSISIGILLDLFRFYNAWVWTSVLFNDPRSSKYKLKVNIVEAFRIAIHEKEAEKNEGYKNRIYELAYHIHSLFVKTKHPHIDHKIRDSRTYPEILSMSLKSIILGLLLLEVFILVVIFQDAGNLMVWGYFVGLILLILITVLFGKIKVQQEYQKSTELIGSLIRKAYDESPLDKGKDLDNFFEGMKKIELIEEKTVDGTDFKWQVKK